MLEVRHRRCYPRVRRQSGFESLSRDDMPFPAFFRPYHAAGMCKD